MLAWHRWCSADGPLAHAPSSYVPLRHAVPRSTPTSRYRQLAPRPTPSGAGVAQLSPAGADVTVPAPVPARVYVNANPDPGVVADGTFDSAERFGTSSLVFSAK